MNKSTIGRRTLPLARMAGTLLLVTALMLSTMGAKGCKDASGNNKYSPYIHLSINALKEAERIFAANGIPTGKLGLAIKAGEAAVAAFDAGGTNAIDLASAFITAFEGIADDAELIKDPKTRTIVMVALAVGNVALHTLAEILKSQESSAPGLTGSQVSVLRAFAAQPKWRCRSSVSGRFEKMEVCKANPETTTVERVK